MNKKESIEHINTKIASGFEKIENKLKEAENIADLFEALFAEIEEEFQVPFVWFSVADISKSAPVIEAIKASSILKDRLNVIRPNLFREIFFSGLKPVLVNNNLKPYYKLFPPNKGYFVKSMAMVPFKMNGEIVGSWNNGDAAQNRYSPDMDTNLLQKLARSLSSRLDEIVGAKKCG
ncbi:MAG: GAF domain-containing protein [Smithella sp.]|jgi:uncharacterized protein YigA (DUF484 family)